MNPLTQRGILLPFAGPMNCERCGKQFICGASLAGCWCTEIKLTEWARAELRKRYPRCLCRQCLEDFASGAKGVRAQQK